MTIVALQLKRPSRMLFLKSWWRQDIQSCQTAQAQPFKWLIHHKLEVVKKILPKVHSAVHVTWHTH